jgi:hypothetical protein
MSSTAAAARLSRQQKSPVGQKQIGRPKKITPEISSSVETRSIVDSCLTDLHILRQIHERCANVQLSEALVSIKGNRLGFRWRSPLVKQDLSVPPQFGTNGTSRKKLVPTPPSPENLKACEFQTRIHLEIPAVPSRKSELQRSH